MSGFFGIVLGTYIAINAYLFARLFSTLAGSGVFKVIVCAVFLLFTVSFPVSRIFAGKLPEPLISAMALMGSLYIAPMLYGFIFTLAADILRLLNGVIAITHNPPPYSLGVRLWSIAAIFALSMCVTVAGVWNANSPTVVTREVTLGDTARGGNSYLKIAMMSDIHLGALTGPKYIKKLAELTNAQFPDIVLLLGDTVDSAEFFKDEKRVRESADALAGFNSRLGTWAVLGNHDYYAGVPETASFFGAAGVRLLRDEAVTLDDGLILAGRDDMAAVQRGAGRKSIADILAPIAETGDDAQYPVILMDHQPHKLGEAMENGIALQLSGHTHRGQLWPINFIVSWLYEKSYGMYEKEGTRYCVSSGAGVWGPPVRTIGRPEIVIINLTYNKEGGYDQWKNMRN